MKFALPAAAIFLLAAPLAPAHRLDEYLQATLFSVEKDRMTAQITLTPGVAIFPALIAGIDLDADGVISNPEQRAYAGRVLRDVSLSIDGRSLLPRLISVQFSPVEDMKEGRGEIRIDFQADLPAGPSNRKLSFENHHLNGIAAYQVNCLISRDPDIRILAQSRNYSQSSYELDFIQASRKSDPQTRPAASGTGWPLGMMALILIPWLGLRWKQSANSAKGI